MTENSSKKAKHEQWLDRLKNHPVVAALILVGVIIIGLSSVTEALENIQSFFEEQPKTAKEANGSVDDSRIEEPRIISISQSFNYSGVAGCDRERDQRQAIAVCKTAAEAYETSNSVELLSVSVENVQSEISHDREPFPSNARTCESQGTATCSLRVK
jgi:hypothetical protein